MSGKHLRLCVLVGLALVGVAPVGAATVQVTLTQPPAGMLTLDYLWNAKLTTAGGPVTVYLHGYLMREGVVVVSGKSANTLTLANGNWEVRSVDISGVKELHYQEAYKGFTVRGGSYPAGTYKACLEVYDFGTNQKLGGSCIDVPVFPPGAPRLIAPRDSGILPLGRPNPLMSWTRPIPSPSGPITYVLTLVEALPGQAPLTAIRDNTPWFRQTGVARTNLTYPSHAKALVAGKRYVWQVTATGASGAPVGEPSGAFTFTLASGSVAPYPYYVYNESCCIELNVYNVSFSGQFYRIGLTAIGNTVIKKVECPGWFVSANYPTAAIVSPLPLGTPIPYVGYPPVLIEVWLKSSSAADQMVEARWFGKAANGKDTVLCSEVLQTPCLRAAEGGMEPRARAEAMSVLSRRWTDTAALRREELASRLDDYNRRLMTDSVGETVLAALASRDSAARQAFMSPEIAGMLARLDSLVDADSNSPLLLRSIMQLQSRAESSVVSRSVIEQIRRVADAAKPGAAPSRQGRKGLKQLVREMARARIVVDTARDELCDSVWLRVDEGLTPDVDCRARFKALRDGCGTFKCVNTSTYKPADATPTYTWDVTFVNHEDGTCTHGLFQSQDKNPVFQFTQTGEYFVALHVEVEYDGATDDDWADTSATLVLPLAEFKWRQRLDVPVVDFESQSLFAGPATQLWEFTPEVGPTSQSTGPNPTYAVPAPGTYTVLLTVEDGCGCTSESKTVLEVSENPVADFGWEYCCTGSGALGVRFRNYSNGYNTPLTSTWDFGDGSATQVANGGEVIHPYTSVAPGSSFDVKLTVEDVLGNTGEVTKMVTLHDCSVEIRQLLCCDGRVTIWVDGADKYEVDFAAAGAEPDEFNSVRHYGKIGYFSIHDAPVRKWVPIEYWGPDSCHCVTGDTVKIDEIACLAYNDGVTGHWPDQNGDAKRRRVKIELDARTNFIYHGYSAKVKLQRRYLWTWWNVSDAEERARLFGASYTAAGTWDEVNGSMDRCNCAVYKYIDTRDDPWDRVYYGMGQSFCTRKGEVGAVYYAKRSWKNYTFEANLNWVDPVNGPSPTTWDDMKLGRDCDNRK